MKHTRLLLLIVLMCTMQISFAVVKRSSEYYGTGLCEKPGYKCITVQGGQSWEKLFPDEEQRHIVQAVNRTNMRLWRGKKIAVPVDLAHKTLLDVAPFPRKIAKQPTKLIIVDQERLAWGAYNREGELVKWGSISSGKDYCPDIGRKCTTQTGVFYIFNKKDGSCRSGIFPVGEGGAKMPYCMFFYKGFALHGSPEVPGYRASHGCVRIFTNDAKWLNENFVDLRQPSGEKGTKVVIQSLTKESSH